jgi:hypothetical protein
MDNTLYIFLSVIGTGVFLLGAVIKTANALTDRAARRAPFLLDGPDPLGALERARPRDDDNDNHE